MQLPSGCCFVVGPSGHSAHQHTALGFAQGTTTNNRYMLPFRTGAFLAGVPVQPIILKYSQVGRID